ncbi:hypothetical protein [Actinacidiphila glaucinigra]
MTTRAEWESLLDRLAVDELISGYGAAVDDGDWTTGWRIQEVLVREKWRS